MNSTCSIWPNGHRRKRIDGAGCHQKWFTQTCACAGEIQLNMANTCASDPEVDATILHRSCDVVSANPNDPYDTVHHLDLLVQDDDGTSGIFVSSNEEGHLVVGNSNGDAPLHLAFTQPM